MGQLCSGNSDSSRGPINYRKSFKGTETDRNYFYNPDYLKTQGTIKTMIIKKSHNKSEQGENSDSSCENEETYVHKNSLTQELTLTSIVRESIQVRFQFEKTLGEGAYGKVKIASLRNDPEKKFAVKSIPRHLFDMAGIIKLRENKKNVLEK